ncbi:MAG: fibrobacter succinogenes major paralogous domain-containing protein, partial [Bacteroidota bacterium]
MISGSMVVNQLHYARAYARTSSGIFYSNEKTFTPAPGQPCPGPGVSMVTDIDGNVYQGIQIGTQCWTQSNLKVSKYRNGDNIPTGLSNSAWENTTSGAYAIYDNNSVNDGLYGKLYNHYAVTDSRGLCPTGWHVPTDAEWTTLENQLGGSSVAGGALKSTAMQPTPGGWASPNTGATNSSGFTALPGLLRNSNGNFDGIPAFNGFWWSSFDTSGGSNVMFRSLDYSGSNINRNTYGST